ncbi:MAG TPA: sulfurtransferase TusA family protein [Burkholderiales bacterium]
MNRHVLDARYLLCPLPVIRVQNAVARLAPGDILEVRATDPGALHDIPAWCRVHGHAVLSALETEGEMRVTLKVGAP